MREIWKRIAVMILAGYISFVYKTSRVVVNGRKELLTSDRGEKMIALFWHGDAYCLYPALKGSKLYVLVTKDRRGDYITGICDYFGYHTVRIPDSSDGGNYLFKIRNLVNNKDVSNLAVSLDGPLGPYHIPKDFAFITALLTKRKLMPVRISVKRKIEFKRRWDQYKIPLPFNEIVLDFNGPEEVAAADKADGFASLKERIRAMME